MFGTIFRFLLTWIPFLRRLFPDTTSKDQHKDEGTTDRLPRARVAIIGSGIGGGFAAYFLREFGPELDIHMWRKKGSKVGGRTAVVEFDGHLYESGASVIHTSNKYLVDLAKKFGKFHFCQPVVIRQSTITGLEWWTGPVDWTKNHSNNYIDDMKHAAQSYKANLEAYAIGNTNVEQMSYWLLEYLHIDNAYRLGIVLKA